MRTAFLIFLASSALACSPSPSADPTDNAARLPTGKLLDPAGAVYAIGQMPLAMVRSPNGRRIVVLLNGYREQGIEVIDLDGRIVQTISQEAAFIGLAFSPDGKALYASGGNQDVIYRYAWQGDSAVLRDSLVLAVREKNGNATHYPAGIAVSQDGARVFVAENLADSLAILDAGTGNIVQRLPTGRYPYAVAIGADGVVFVSNWGASNISVFAPGADGRLTPLPPIAAGRHPSAMLMNSARTRLFVASGSTDRISVVDVISRAVIKTLEDSPPSGPREGSTPNALTLSTDGTRLYVAEADANAVAVFDLSASAAGNALAKGNDQLSGRIPAGWYPTSLIVQGEKLFVANGKGAGAGPNPDGPNPSGSRARKGTSENRQYTLGQIAGTLSIIPLVEVSEAGLASFTSRVNRANGWDKAVTPRRYPPFTHVIYVIKENRTYDQVFGDITTGDGDTSLVLFGRKVTPNQHSMAERFGLYDRFFVNAEVSADGHNWSMAAYATDYVQKTAPTNYSGDGRSYDFEGTNRDSIVGDDVAEPARGYLWDLAERAGITFRNFGEFAEKEGEGEDQRYRGTKPYLALHTDSLYPYFDMDIPDQRRADIWLRQFHQWDSLGQMPALQIINLPRDHTGGARAGSSTPEAMVADNDLALGRIIEGLSRSRFWENTVVFVLEDDAQNGPDHVDSHRSGFLVISAWNRPGLQRRFTNTTDALSTIEEILGLEALSQFDHFGRPLREVWTDSADLSPYVAMIPEQSLDEKNPAHSSGAIESRRLDLATADAADMELFNQILWRAVKGPAVPYPGATRMSLLETIRAR
ncbi:MAG: bifunctional YncE family protein/alkaline phosphatase family protein [Gemmatimonadota bacterium]